MSLRPGLRTWTLVSSRSARIRFIASSFVSSIGVDNRAFLSGNPLLSVSLSLLLPPIPLELEVIASPLITVECQDLYPAGGSFPRNLRNSIAPPSDAAYATATLASAFVRYSVGTLHDFFILEFGSSRVRVHPKAK